MVPRDSGAYICVHVYQRFPRSVHHVEPGGRLRKTSPLELRARFGDKTTWN